MDKKTLSSKTVKDLRTLCLERSLKPETLKDDIISQLVKYEQKQKRLAKKVKESENNTKLIKNDTKSLKLNQIIDKRSDKTTVKRSDKTIVKRSDKTIDNKLETSIVNVTSEIIAKQPKKKRHEKDVVTTDNTKKTSDGKYTILKQLGKTGKEGTTFLVVDKKGVEYAMKVFPKQKSINTLLKEVGHQNEAARHGIAPEIKEINEDEKYIVMEKLDKNLFDIVKKNNGEIPETIQRKIVNIIKRMDETGVFHGDPNPANFMMKGTTMYMIDYGFARDIDDKLMKKYETKTPNKKFMILGLILKLKEIYREHNPNIEYKVLSKILS